MTKFCIEFTRRVVTYDRVTRVINAATQDEALARADEMALGFNNACPDDSEESDELELGDWVAEPSDLECQTCAESIETRSFPCDECGAIDENDDDDSDDHDSD